MRIIILAAIAAASLSACATTSQEARIRAGLREAGVSRPVADCMAERLADRLSPAQLDRLADVAMTHREELRRMTVQQLLRRSATLLDPEVSAAVTRAGIGCSIAG
jgi:uncharacterized membrane protein YebE (DUF533 family)